MDGMIEASLDVERFMQFCDILEKTQDYEAFVNSMRTQLAICLCEHNIEQKVKLESLVPLLEDEAVLTPSEAKELLDTPAEGRSDKTLLSYLYTKDADKWLIFLDCLKKDGQRPLVRIIEEKIHPNNEKNKGKKVWLRFTSRDSGIFSPSPTPMSCVQPKDLSDGLSRLAIIKEETSYDSDLDVIRLINYELDSLDEQHKNELERMERYYEEMQLILETKKNDAQMLLNRLHWDQKRHVKDQIRRGQRDQFLAGKMNWLPQEKPDAFVKIMTDTAAVDQIKGWNIPVIVGSAHCSTTKARGLGLKWACTNKAASFAVEFRDIQDHLLIAKSMDDMMDLTSHCECMIMDSEGSEVQTEQHFLVLSPVWVEGVKTITYVPTVTGYLDILVKCGGRPISGSPFKVLVYPVSEYYRLLTCPQEILCTKVMITGLTTTSTGHVVICTESGKLYIVRDMDGEYRFDDVAAYHGSLSLNYPCGISCDSNDNLVIANTRNSQLVKASTPEAKEKLFVSSEIKFEPMCVAAHDTVVAAGGSRDVVICDHNLDILHTINFSSLVSALTITNNLNVHVAVSEIFGCKCYNYACIENIDSKAYKTRFAHLSPSKTTNHNNRINDIVTDKDHNIIVCYTAQPVVAIFNSNGELLSCYENWESDCYTEFAAVAVSQHSGLLLIDQTRNKLLESHLDQNLAIYTPSLY